ncbi:hypothetical protein ABZ208_10790 [Streptomyces sp. NPDC006208]|uniref:hypothetical protein n=1 Tax=Streptomyces sp. NPDC006208 TaxID=3156734 RepID=UPI00339E9A90
MGAPGREAVTDAVVEEGVVSLVAAALPQRQIGWPQRYLSCGRAEVVVAGDAGLLDARAAVKADRADEWVACQPWHMWSEESQQQT